MEPTLQQLSHDMAQGFAVMHEGFETMNQKIDDLALATKEGFDEMATKKDLERFATKDDLEDLARMTQAGFDRIESAFHSETRVTRARLDRLEVHAGIS